MFHRLGVINRNQRGFTLIELLIAVGITGIITAAITMSIFQVYAGNARTSNHMTAVRQVQNAGYWISHDAQMAESVEPEAAPDPDGFPLTLTWTDRNGDEHKVVYTLLADNTLQRDHYTNYDPVTNPDPDATSVVARYIDSISCQFAGGKLVFTVTASVGSGSHERSETRTYEVIPRPGS